MEAVNPNLDLDEVRLRARIAAAIEKGGGTKRMVEKAGIPLGTLEKYFAQTSTPSFVNAAKIAAGAGVALDDIAFSSAELSTFGGTFKLGDLVQRIADNSGWLSDRSAPFSTALVQLPLYDVDAAAGTGTSIALESQLGVVAFDRQFLRDRGASPDNCTVIRARGDSMTPTIPDGSLLIVDHSQRDVTHGFITVIGIGEDLLVKRVRKRLDGTVELISDNPAYPPEVIGSDRIAALRVIGRVVYFCRAP